MTATLSEQLTDATETLADSAPVRRGVLKALTHEHGDMEISWDPRNATEVGRAREAFDGLVRTHLLYKIDENGEREQIHEFDEHAARIVAVPPLQGG